MDEVQENEPDKPVLATQPNIHGYSVDESRVELNPIPYFHEDLSKGLGSGDASSLFYNGSDFDSGGLHSSAFVEGKDAYKDRNMDKVPSDDGVLDLFSSIGLPIASEDLCWDFDFTKKLPAPDYQFPQVSDSWNSNMVSQSSWSNNKAVGVPELLSSQNTLFQNNQIQSQNINYMTSFAWDMPMNASRGVNSSCYDPPLLGDFKYIGSPLNTCKSYPFNNNGYLGTSHATNNCMMAAPTTSLSLQNFGAGILGEGAKVVDDSFQAAALNNPTYSYNLQNFSEVSPMDTSESYHCSNEGYLGNPLAAPSPSLSVQCTDVNIKADDQSLLSILMNQPKFSFDQQDLGEAIPPACIGATHDIELSETIPVDGDTEAVRHTLQGVSVNYITEASNVQDIGEGNIDASPIETRDSQHGSNEGDLGTVHEVNLLGMSYNSMFMQFTDPSLFDGDAEANDPLSQNFNAMKAVDSIGEPISVLSPVDTGESHDRSSEENVATSNIFDSMAQGLARNSIFLQETEVIPGDEQTEDDPIFESMLIHKPGKCRKVGRHRQKGVLRPLQRCSNDIAAVVKTRLKKRGRKEEPIESFKGKQAEADLQNKRLGKRVKDGAMFVHDAVLTRRSNKEFLESDDEYDPLQSNFKVGRSRRGNSGRKNNRLWTLSEVVKLVNGVSQYGVGKWTAIQRTFPGSPPSRSSLDIRDKWRNLIRTSGLRLKNMEEDEFSPKYGSLQLPKSMLERICELDRAQPYLRSDGAPRTNCRDDDLADSSSE